MKISPVSFLGWANRATKKDHAALDIVAKKYSNDSNADKKFIALTHDVFDVVPWCCSEGESLEQKDIVITDEFMETLNKNLSSGNKKLAYALGTIVQILSPAGRAVAYHDDDPDFPMGSIDKLGSTLTSKAKKNPELKAIKEDIAHTIKEKL